MCQQAQELPMDHYNKGRVQILIEKGVKIANPLCVDVGEEVDLNRISGNGVIIYSGCKIYGEKMLIMPGVRLGCEAPVTIRDCQIGPNVDLRGGFFVESVFFEKAHMGSGAQVRETCILEEEANAAHTVGLKHTILFPFVTLGSLINFCDCLMAGGTNRKNHSEVGSSYIHFNYTPNQDKATPSLIGDVPRGVMLNQKPIFLGGQGGLVGPSRLGYGTVIAAGTVYREDSPKGGKLLIGKGLKKKDLDFYPGLYWDIERRIFNNINYVTNLIALRQWYLNVRSQFFQGSSMIQELYKGALEKLDMAIDERIERLKDLAQKMPLSTEIYRKVMKTRVSKHLLNQKKELLERWQQIEDVLRFSKGKVGDTSLQEAFLEKINQDIKENGRDYIRVIQGLGENWSRKGIQWLQGIVDEINQETLEKIPSFKSLIHMKHKT